MAADHFEDKTDQERILSLVAEGKISQEEADRLLAALRDTEQDIKQDTDSIEAERDEVERETARGTTPAITAISGHARPNSKGAEQPDIQANPDTWADIDMSAGSLQVSVDATLSEPVLESEGHGVATLDRTSHGWNVFLKGKSRGGWEGRSFSATLRIPAGCGVDLKGKAGSVTLDGVPYLKGDMAAGTLKATQLGGFDLDMSAGTLRLSARLCDGEHRLEMSAGTAVVTLLPGSSVQVEGDVRAGSLRLPDSFERTNKIAGADFRGKVGSGKATLNLGQRAGTLELRCE